MAQKPKKAIIVSISSDIGHAMALRWQKAGHQVCGTYRTKSDSLEALTQKGIKTFQCDLASTEDVIKTCQAITETFGDWDTLVLCPGAQEPVGAFLEVDFDDWATSIEVNFTNQLRFVHALLPTRRVSEGSTPSVLFFAGGGTNNAPVNYSAYIISKIGLMKMTELLDAEVPDTNFTILGPGWVKTKIHNATLEAGARAGSNYERTLEKLKSKELTPMEDVLDCCDWLVTSDRELVGGRNFSVVFDAWGEEKLNAKLKQDKDLYKLRRAGNDFMLRRT